MSETIQFNPKRIKAVDWYEGTADFDELYSVVLEKTQNGSVKYNVVSIKDEQGLEINEQDSRYPMIYKSVIKYAEKNGIGS